MGEGIRKETCAPGWRREGPCAQDPSGGSEPRLGCKARPNELSVVVISF